MVPATAEKPKPKGKSAPTTKELPLNGERSDDQKNLKGEVVSEKPPLVVELAREHANNIDQMRIWRDKCKVSGQELLQGFRKSKKKRYVKVATDYATHTFETDETLKLVHERDEAFNG